MTFTIPK